MNPIVAVPEPPRSDWVISGDRTHPALISDADFLSVQQITALAVPADGRVHRYQLTGLLVCGLCGRRLEGHWVNRRPGYRCRHGHTTAQLADTDGPGWVYWSQTRIVEHVVATGDRDLVGVADAGDLAARLRARDALIVCGPDTVAIEEPVTDDTNPRHSLRITYSSTVSSPCRCQPGRSGGQPKGIRDQTSGYRRRGRKPQTPIEIHIKCE